MVDPDILRDHGLTPDKLEEWLKGDPDTWDAVPHTPDSHATGGFPIPQGELTDRQKRHRLLLRIRSRIQEGMSRNFADFPIYHALDLAWNTPLRGVSATMVRDFLDSDPNTDQVYQAAQRLNLTSLITQVPDPKDPTKSIKRFNFPTFFEVLVPLVRSYVTIRRGKIMNDRKLTPFFKYEPLNPTAELTVKCEAITQRVQTMHMQYDYYSTVDQAVFAMLHYGQQLVFPMEEWHSESQLKNADAYDVMMGAVKYGQKDAIGNDMVADIGDVIEAKTREGIRYGTPHPSRTYRDLAHPPCTFNSDSGCEYGGYWAIRRFKDIYNNTNYWNRDKVSLGVTDIMTANRVFFNTVYPCAINAMGVATPPAKMPSGVAGAYEMGAGAGQDDRESAIATTYYGSEHGDQGCLVTEHFEKLVPKDNGIGTYPFPVWFRFVVAGDGATVLYAAPMVYSPIIYYGYDPDQNRRVNSSLSLETLPFQDMFSQVLTQTVLTAKQNLANITFVDEAQLPEDSVRKVENIGEGLYRSLNILRFNSRQAARGLNKVAEAVIPATLPKGSTAELINVLREILNILERVLVMSSQEIAQAASHELRVDEVKNIAQSTSSRLQFTATPVDLAREAHKRQIYQGLMAHGDPKFFVSIPSDVPLTYENLEAMGFTFGMTEKGGKNPGRERAVNVLSATTAIKPEKHVVGWIDKKKTALPIWWMASTRDGDERNDNTRLGVAMAQAVGVYMQNPMTSQAIGPDQAIELGNRIFHFLGLPKDFKMRNVGGTPEQQQAAQQQQLKQITDLVTAIANQVTIKGIEPLLEENKQQSREIDFIFKALGLPQLNGSTNGSEGSTVTARPAAVA